MFQAQLFEVLFFCLKEYGEATNPECGFEGGLFTVLLSFSKGFKVVLAKKKEVNNSHRPMRIIHWGGTIATIPGGSMGVPSDFGTRLGVIHMYWQSVFVTPRLVSLRLNFDEVLEAET